MAISKSIQDKIEKHALSQLNLRKDFNASKVNLHFHRAPIGRGTVISRGGGRVVHAARESTWVLVDYAPLHNWGHPCEVMLYDATSGEHYETYSAQFPPDSYFHQKEQYVALHEPVKFPPQKPLPALASAKTQPLNRALNAVRGKRYALLFSGMSDNRHLNDMEFLYRTLLDVYGFDAADISVLNYNGTTSYAGAPSPIGNWPGDNTPYRIQIHYSGTKQNMLQALDAIQQKLQADDLLLIHTNNHGDGPLSASQIPSKEADLCCYPAWDSLRASEFGEKIQALPRHYSLMVMMEQCHSGGFKNAVLDNSHADMTSFAAACEETAHSIGGIYFDPFARDWIAAVTGNNPSGSALLSPVPFPASANDAFVYADAIQDLYDTPVYADNPASCGQEQFLVAAAAAPLLSDESLSDVTATNANFRVTCNQNATAHWLVLPANAPAPTADQMVAGAGGNTGAMAANTAFSRTLSGLSSRTAYRLHFVASNNNVFSTVWSQAFDTDALPIVGLPTGVDGRILTPAQTGDTVNWIEIARNGNYFLLIRAHYLHLHSNASLYGNPDAQYIPYGATSAYNSSNVRNKINAWFNGSVDGAADKLPQNARLRNYTVQHNAINTLGTCNTEQALTDGLSQPTLWQVSIGNDIAFAPSWAESANFLSISQFRRGPIANIPSPAEAVANYKKINIPSGWVYGMWLRSVGDTPGTAGALANADGPVGGRVFQMNVSAPNERGYVYPAVWVDEHIFYP